MYPNFLPSFFLTREDLSAESFFSCTITFTRALSVVSFPTRYRESNREFKKWKTEREREREKKRKILDAVNVPQRFLCFSWRLGRLFFHRFSGVVVLLHWPKPIVFEWDNNTWRGELRDSREQRTVLPNASNTVLHASKMIASAGCIMNFITCLVHCRETAGMNYLLSQRELTNWFASEFYFRHESVVNSCISVQWLCFHAV